MKAVILAGGTGTRLWPLSRTGKPKQFNDVVGETSLIQDTYRRLLRSFPKEKIYFSISPAFDALLHEHFPEIDDGHILIEPEKRDTGPAMGYVAALLGLDDPDEPIVFIPSDHYIRDEERFLESLRVGESLILQTGKLLDIGIEPSFPSTVLGYTKIGDAYATVDGVDVFAFAGHTEKPPYDVAKTYLEDGSYLWHANYYMWTPKAFLSAFDTHAPELGEGLRKIQDAALKEDAAELARVYASLPKISFDYAVTEHMGADEMLVIKGDFGWSDIGAWDTLYDRLSDDGQSVTKGNVVLLDTTESLVYAPEDKLVAVIGLDKVVVVDTGDALLVCRHGDAQRVKEIVSHLKDNGHEHLL